MSDEPSPLIFYFNNSSIPLLTCSRQYKYRVIDGAKPSPFKAKHFVIGLAFHHFMKLIGTQPKGRSAPLDLITLMADQSLWYPDAKSLPNSFVMQLAVAAENMYKSQPNLFRDCIRERFIEFDAPTDMPETIQPRYCLTSDLISYDQASDTVLVTDYKTTKDKLDGAIVAKYNLSAQRFYYECRLVDIAADPNNTILPPHYKDAINKQRLKFGYWFYSHTEDKDFLAPHTYTDFNRLAEFRPLFEEKLQLATYLHLNPSQTVKEGVLLNACRMCEYSSICGLHNDKNEAEQFAKWPYGFAKYYPKHD